MVNNAGDVFSQPADCARAVTFLTSEAASYVTGSTIAFTIGIRMD